MNTTSGATDASHNPMNYASAPGTRRTSLVQIGAGLGIAANMIGWAIFLMMCAGFEKAIVLALIPFGLALVGMTLTVVGGVFQKDAGDVETHVLAAIFINLFGLVGGWLEVATWRGWSVFPR